MYKAIIVCLLIPFCITNLSFAEDNPATTSNNNQSNKFCNFKTTGYFDGSYNYLLNSNQFSSGINNKVYDLEENDITLQQAAITIASQPAEGFGLLLNPILGQDAFTTAAYGFDPDIGLHRIGFDLLQAYAQYATKHFTVIAGKFVTLAGAEFIDPTQDTNFSRSILFGYAEPSTHAGARGTYTVNKNLKLIAGVNNGWDSIRDTSRTKTIELGGSYTFNPKFSLRAQGYTGEQRATNRVSTGPTGIRNLINIIATYNATDKLTFIANYDYGTQSKAALPNDKIARANWEGIAAYVNYKFNKKWRTSLRGEIFDDQDGYRTGVRQTWKEVTLTLGYLPKKCVELRLETRHDFSNVHSFVNRDDVNVSNNQQSFALEGILKF